MIVQDGISTRYVPWEPLLAFQSSAAKRHLKLLLVGHGQRPRARDDDAYRRCERLTRGATLSARPVPREHERRSTGPGVR